MKMYVVDTNVPIVANGGDNIHANELCQLACIKKLNHLVKSEIVAIDETGLILKEYRKHLSSDGPRKVGNQFYKYLLNHQYSHERIKRVEISPTNDEGRGFNELPENKLDASDRKFLAVAMKAKATIVNATDSDWAEQASLMNDLRVDVCQLCPEHAER